MLFMMINVNYKILSPANDEFQMRISSEEKTQTRLYASVDFWWGFQTYPVFGDCLAFSWTDHY